ncbi:MAG: S-adenosylmethionine:tRNA ribosyltransferase-isomerase [Candidatus Kapaibacteriota bacterium]
MNNFQEKYKEVINNIAQSINLTEFDYDLPKEKIAQFPLENRSDSKLIKVEKSSRQITHHNFYNLPELLNDNSLLIVNNSKVIQARILLNKPSGGKIEFLLLDSVYPSLDPQITLKETDKLIWKVIIGGKRAKVGLTIITLFNDTQINFKLLEKEGNEGLLEINLLDKNGNKNSIPFGEILEQLGKIPLPPYMDRENIENDKESYQTVYAKYDGSVAAPTAGLHFTEDIMQKLKDDKNIDINSITLHVGAGTFSPIKDENIENHLMHTEKITVSLELIKQLKSKIIENKNIIAVGTTSTRTIESLYWLGCKILLGKTPNLNNFDEVIINQWDAYLISEELKNIGKSINTLEALESIINYIESKRLKHINCATQLLILPSYEYKIINVLVTNFHAPKSTLILLVSAYLGIELWREYYNQALKNDYRFLSYGDSSILFLNK